jgi:argininosuccinate lyase
VFESAEQLSLCLQVMTGIVETMQVHPQAMRTACEQGFITATDLADWLVRELNMPFRQAHHVTGSLVKQAQDKGCDLADLSLEIMQAVEPSITKAIFDVLTVEASVASRTSYGGTAPVRVKESVQRWKKVIS